MISINQKLQQFAFLISGYQISTQSSHFHYNNIEYNILN